MYVPVHKDGQMTNRTFKIKERMTTMENKIVWNHEDFVYQLNIGNKTLEVTRSDGTCIFLALSKKDLLELEALEIPTCS